MPDTALTTVVTPLVLAVIGAYLGVTAVVPLNRLATWGLWAIEPSRFVPAGIAFTIELTVLTVLTPTVPLTG